MELSNIFKDLSYENTKKFYLNDYVKNDVINRMNRDEIIDKFYNNPVISLGIIGYYIDYPYDKNNSIKKIFNDFSIKNEKYPHIKILMIQRRNTMGYIDLIRGRYFYNDPNFITKVFFNEMTIKEREKIRKYTFDELWNDLWFPSSESNNNHYKNDYKRSKYKFSKLNINKLLSSTKSKYKYTEFGLPKGRIANKETNFVCAKREFKEETNYEEKNYEIIKDLGTIEENFIGSNNITYKHIFYFAKFKKFTSINDLPHINMENRKQVEEILNVDFLSYEEIMHVLRPYEESKVELFDKVFEMINSFSL